MKFSLDTIIFYVQNVDRLKVFYMNTFGLTLIEEYGAQWALLKAGDFKIGLHQIGEQYIIESKGAFKFHNNTKIVFEITEDIAKVRAHMLSQNVLMREVKTFDNYAYWLCDGEDPEGNVFQLKQKK